MALLGFNHYNLRADSATLEQLKHFYCEVVGMTLGARPALRSFGYWLYIGDKDVLHLSLAAENEIRAQHLATTFDHVAFSCTQQAEMEARLQAHKVEYRTREVSATGLKQVFFKDPAGNGVEFNFVD